MKIKNYLKKNRKTIITAVLILAAAVVAYILAHKVATIERRYSAVGGEIFIPFLILFGEDILEMIKSPFKAVKNCED